MHENASEPGAPASAFRFRSVDPTVPIAAESDGPGSNAPAPIQW